MAKIIIQGLRMPKKKIRQILRFAAPRNTVLPPVIFVGLAPKDSVIEGRYILKDEREKCLLKVARAKYNDFPFLMTITPKERRQGYKSGFWLNDREEALTYIASHEFRHSFQAQHPYAKRYGWRKNTFSESDADWYALKKLDEWRKLKRKTPSLKGKKCK